MLSTFTVPAEYGYVIATAAFSSFIAQWHSRRTGKYRRAAKVPYPNAYAPEAEAKDDHAKYLFNCAQRSHANFIEHQPAFLTTLLLSGLRYPTASAAMGLVWNLGRVLYAVGYTNKNKTRGSGRLIGNFFWIPELALQFVAAYTGYKMVVG